MNMTLRWIGALLLGLTLAGTPWAQEPAAETEGEEAKPEPWGELHVEVEAWIAQPAGLDYKPTLALDPADPFGAQTLTIPYGTKDAFRYVGAFTFRRGIGQARLSWYSHEDGVERAWFSPGQFVFATVVLAPFRAGFEDNGLADAVRAETFTQLRDLRLDFLRPAFEGPRLSLRWFAGYRRVFHNRRLSADYFAVVPDLPPIIPPLVPTARTDLDPLSDFGTVASKFEGRGAEAGLEADLVLRPNRLALETGFAVAVLRGQIDTVFESITHAYAQVEGNKVTSFVDPPFDVFGTKVPEPGSGKLIPFVDNVRQVELIYALNGTRESSTAQVLDTHVGFRWRVWKAVQLRFGFRNVHYSNVGLDIRPEEVVLESDLSLDDFRTVDGQPIPFLRLHSTGLQRTSRSVDYEGYYVAVGYTF